MTNGPTKSEATCMQTLYDLGHFHG